MYFISQRRPLFDEPCPFRLSPAVPDNRDLPTGGNPLLFQSKSGLGEHFSRPQRCVVLPFAPQISEKLFWQSRLQEMLSNPGLVFAGSK